MSFVAIICSYWLEQNDRIFNNTSCTVNSCVIRTYMNVLLWTDQLSDRKQQVCLSDYNDNYLQDISLVDRRTLGTNGQERQSHTPLLSAGGEPLCTFFFYSSLSIYCFGCNLGVVFSYLYCEVCTGHASSIPHPRTCIILCTVMSFMYLLYYILLMECRGVQSAILLPKIKERWTRLFLCFLTAEDTKFLVFNLFPIRLYIGNRNSFLFQAFLHSRYMHRCKTTHIWCASSIYF